VKIQGPFNDVQLNSVAKGMAHLQKLGLVSVLVIDRDDLPLSKLNSGNDDMLDKDPAETLRQRTLVLRDLERVVDCLVRHRAPARPILATVARIFVSSDHGEGGGKEVVMVEEEGLEHIRRALEEGEIPVLMPVALDEGCKSRRIDSNQLIRALAEAMAGSSASASTSGTKSVQRDTISAGNTSPNLDSNPITEAPIPSANLPTARRKIDLTPMRLLIINREGGIPSYARLGLPHLSINLTSEQNYINSTFLPRWHRSHPTALSNLQLASDCLEYMPKEASALLVSHRSPAALIANLITNKPAHSVSLPHALLAQTESRITRDTPTLIRRGLPVRVLRRMEEIDWGKFTELLEKSFGRTLNQDSFRKRLENDLDFLIVIGDYAGAALVTHEGRDLSVVSPTHRSDQSTTDICYLDKFAVLPSHQGDGTVDFLWVALRDETYGLGLLDASNPSEGSLSGKGKGRDLVWRSRANNPVNKWYAERSNGNVTMGGWKMFWCDAEERVEEYGRDGGEWGGGRLVRVVEESERGRLGRWAPIIEKIASAWV